MNRDPANPVTENISISNNELTAPEAARRLGVSVSTFRNRLKLDPNIKPVRENPNLARQHDPHWLLSDVDSLGVVVDSSETGTPPNISS